MSRGRCALHSRRSTNSEIPSSICRSAIRSYCSRSQVTSLGPQGIGVMLVNSSIDEIIPVISDGTGSHSDRAADMPSELPMIREWHLNLPESGLHAALKGSRAF